MSTTERARTRLGADDHPSVLRTLTDLLRARGVDDVASTTDGEEAAHSIRELQPSLALLDLQFPGQSGLDSRAARAEAPDTAIVVYSWYGDPATVREALDAGARFVVKNAPLEGLNRRPDLRRVRPLRLLGRQRDAPARVRAARAHRARALVLRLLADGCSYDEAGNQLYISPETGRAHVAKAPSKLGARTQTQAVAEALRPASSPSDGGHGYAGPRGGPASQGT